MKSNEFTVKDSFHFDEEGVVQKPDFFMSSLNVDSLFNYVPEGLNKSEFKELCLATRDLYFAFDGTLYK